MKSYKMLSAMFILFCCLYGVSNGAGARVGVYVGVPWQPFYGYGYPYPYPYVYPYAPPVLAVPAAPQTYVQQPPPDAQTGYWHYCNDPKGYYPYIKACPGGWQLVEPNPQR